MQRASGIEQVLKDSESQHLFLIPGECAGRWTEVFAEAAQRVPEPYWLFAEDEQRQLVLGYPLLLSPGRVRLQKDIGRLIDTEAHYRRAVTLRQEFAKPALVAMRTAMFKRMSEVIENTILHDYGQRLAGLQPPGYWTVNSSNQRLPPVLSHSVEFFSKVTFTLKMAPSPVPSVTCEPFSSSVKVVLSTCALVLWLMNTMSTLSPAFFSEDQRHSGASFGCML